MAITHVGSAASLPAGGSTNADITHGLTISEGDRVVIYLNIDADVTITPDQTWDTSSEDVVTGQSAKQAIFTKLAGASEPSTYGFDLSASTQSGTIIKVFSSATDTEIDAAINWHVQLANSNDLVCGAADGEVISDNAVSVIFGGKDGGATAEDYTTADNSYTGVTGGAGGHITGAAHRIYTTGTTFSGDITLETADSDDGRLDKVYSGHVSFIETAGGSSSALPLINAYYG